MSRLIPDSECVQSKCARNTTGCWDECEMRRSPAMYGLPTPGVYTVSVASPVQGAAISRSTAAEGQWMGEAATSSASGATPADFDSAWAREIANNGGVEIGADYRHWMLKGWRAAQGANGAKGAAVKPWQERLPLCPTPDELHAAKDAEIADWRALADRSPAVQPAGQAVPEGWKIEREGDTIAISHPGIGRAVTYRSARDPADVVLYHLAEQMLATPAPEQEAAPKCPRCKDTGTWTYTEEPGDHGDEYPCMDCGVADAKEAAENLAALLRGLECRPELAEAGADFLFKLGQAIATQAKKAPDAGAAPQPKGENQ